MADTPRTPEGAKLQNQRWQPMPLVVALGSHATGDARTLELE
jgi:hypothetical protein